MADEAGEKLVIRRLIAASPHEVFAAWTDPEIFKEWMCVGEFLTTEAQLDVRVNGPYRFVMRSEDRVFEAHGRYLLVDPPRKLVFTWVTPDTDYQETLVTVELLPQGGSTELVLTHERFPRPPMLDVHRLGWNAVTERLAEVLDRKLRGA